MVIPKNEKLIVDFAPQLPLAWIGKIPSNRIGTVYKVALYIWFVKGWKKSNVNLPITHNEINNYFPMSTSALSKALKELENYQMITVNRKNKIITVNVLCEEYYSPRTRIKH